MICVCISQHPALCLALGPGPLPRSWPSPPVLVSQFEFPSPVLNLCLPALAPNLYLPALASNLYLPVLAPNLYLPALAPNFYLPALPPNFHLPGLAPNLYLPILAYNFIASPGSEFAYTNLVPSICSCIYSPGLWFVLPVRCLNLHLPHYR